MKEQRTADGVFTNLRFADDILVIASSLETLKRMMEYVSEEAKKVGFQHHMGKTKIFTNKNGRRQNKAEVIRIGREKVEILPAGESTKYLGKRIVF